MREIPKIWKPRIDWLKSQAAEAYKWNLKREYFEVRHRAHPYPMVAAPATYNLRQAFDFQHLWRRSFLNLGQNLMMKAWPNLSSDVRNKICNFFKDYNLHDFELFDLGGRAMVFRAMDNNSGRIRVARLEADHAYRSTRPLHLTILPAFASNEHKLEEYERIKLEILAEVVPLHKLPDKTLGQSFHDAVADIATGSNLTYAETMFDRDASPENMAILPDGRVVGLDPEFVYGDEARAGHSVLSKTFIPRNWGLTAAQRLVYGQNPERTFF